MRPTKEKALPVAAGQGDKTTEVGNLKTHLATQGAAAATRGTAPAFQLYAADLLGKREFRLMTLAERGLLLTLLCECWLNSEIPASQDDLASYIGKDVSGCLTDRVLGFFVNRNGALYSPELEDYRARILHRRSLMSEGGRAGGKKRAANIREGSSHPSSQPQGSFKGRGPGPGPSQVGDSPKPNTIEVVSVLSEPFGGRA